VTQVKLILVESIHSLGEAGELVRVKPGYARNFLLPQGKAMLATESRVKELEHTKRIAQEKAAKELNDLKAVKKQLEGISVEIGARAGGSGKLFGSVTSQQIAEQIKAAGLSVDKRRIELGEPIKEVGEHKVKVKLHSELFAEVAVTVTAEGGPSPEEALEEDMDDREQRRRERDESEDDEEDERDAPEAPADDE